jgi:hypothetical protein
VGLELGMRMSMGMRVLVLRGLGLVFVVRGVAAADPRAATSLLSIRSPRPLHFAGLSASHRGKKT